MISGISDGVAGSISTSGMRFDGNSGGVVNVPMAMDMVDDLIAVLFKIRFGLIGVIVLYNLWADFESRIDFLRTVTVMNDTDKKELLILFDYLINLCILRYLSVACIVNLLGRLWFIFSLRK